MCSVVAAADKKPKGPVEKWEALNVVLDKRIEEFKKGTVPVPKMLKFARRLLKTGRLIRAKEVADLCSGRDPKGALKIITAVANSTALIGKWDFGSGARLFLPDGNCRDASGALWCKWKSLGKGRYTLKRSDWTRKVLVSGLTLTGQYAKNPEKKFTAKRVK